MVEEQLPRRTYGVKLVRGPFVRLAPHPDHCEDIDELREYVGRLRRDRPEARLAADLFSGGGGMSLGLAEAGIEPVLSVDHFPDAVQTHRHHFAGLSVDWDLADASVVERIASLMAELDIDVLVGGPPCQPFSKAGRSKIRHRVHSGLRDPHDERRDLWRSFLEVVRLGRPQAVLMENVPDMVLDREMFILRAAVEDLEEQGFSVLERVVDTWRFGVPQFRQRLIMVALAAGASFSWPPDSVFRHTVWNAIGDLPEVEGGWRPVGGADGWAEYDGPLTNFQRAMRLGVDGEDVHRVYDHITRPVRDDDAAAFEAMDSKTRYSELPQELKRYREDIFDDKYKRLDEDDLSRTITAHIAKDGYWYIHPRQNRTLTVREAARLQTFPDWYRFAGPPSSAFRQIGNAVPPALANELGGHILKALAESREAGKSTIHVAAELANWFRRLEVLTRPWLRATTRWQVVQAELLLDRAVSERVRMLWPLINCWTQPDETLGEEDALREIGRLMGREARVDRLLEMADWLDEHPGALEELELGAGPVPGLGEAVANLAVLTVVVAGRGDAEEPVLATNGVLRVAGRYHGEPVDRRNRLTDGRLAVARMIGGGANARDAHKGLIELAASRCRPTDPLCTECPLSRTCASSQADMQRQDRLF